MKIMRLIVLTLAGVVTTLLTVATATAHGAPTSLAASHHTFASTDGTSITSVLTNATFGQHDADALTVLDRHGNTIDRVALSIPLNGVDVPLRTTVSADRTTATLAPQITPEIRAAIAAGMHPASAKKDRAYQKMIWHINNGWNRGGGVATAVGAIVGLIVGCLVLVGCIWGAGVGAAIGAAVGINNGDPQAGQAILTWINTP
ncbi:MAG: hypothetical protein CME34_07660 [Gordonia sp.]|jgi:hypothetical protein|uniref:hypothetical protein n=1 Tax=Gordonia sp. (in: high G+C Gram-positive bacteria) TaxID=84139 RepID=UPI000C600446|nr:hypothetical protein [Gordonia sp. (in: high G+C Gram-positive bacteria)]MAU81735.1 hypothetical protein [Gordonia sp. (in: high G+C Gram-positive bacteria)]